MPAFRPSYVRYAALLIGGYALSLGPVSGQSSSDTLPRDSLPRFKVAPVVVTATRGSATMSQLAAAVNVVERGHLATRSNRLITDLLREEPGILIQQTTAGQGAPFIRALTGSQILLMVDGVRLNNGTFRQGPSQYLATVDPELVQRLEVVRGAASALYGSDAMGGVVNVITRRAADLLRPGARTGAEGAYTFDGATRGSRGRVSVASTFPSVGRGLDIMVGGSYASIGDLEPGAGLPRQDPTGFNMWGTDVRADLSATERLRFEAAYQHFRQDDVPRYDRLVDFRAPGLEGGGPGRSFRYFFEPQDRTLVRLKTSWRAEQSWITILDVQLSYQEQTEGRTITGQSVTSEGTVPSSTQRFEFDGVTSLAADLQAQLLLQRGGTLTYGAEAWRNETSSRGSSTDLLTGVIVPALRTSGQQTVSTGRFPDGSEHSGTAVYAFVDMDLADRWRAQAGVRGSSYWTNSRVGDEFGGDVDVQSSDLSGEVGIVFNATAALDLRVRAAQAFRAPNIYDLTLVGDVPGGIQLPNASLDPETSNTFEAGARLSGDRGWIDLTGFRLEIDGLLDRVKGSFEGDTLFGDDQERVFTVDNVGDARIHGLEASLLLSLPRGGTLRASGFWTRGNATVTRDATLAEEPLSRVPPKTLNARVRWPLMGSEDQLWAEYGVVAASKQTRLGFRDVNDSRIQDGGTPGYGVHSLRAGIEVAEGINLTASWENIFDELYRVHGSGIDAPGRHLFLRAQIRY